MQNQYKRLKKAQDYANEVLLVEPKSLVEQYWAGKERLLKQQVIASRKSRFSKPALPTSTQVLLKKMSWLIYVVECDIDSKSGLFAGLCKI